MIGAPQQMTAALVSFIEIGAGNACPFCRGKMIYPAQDGREIIRLSGYRCGEKATVCVPLVDEDNFIVKVDSDPPETTRLVSYSRDEFCYTPLIPPAWAPPLSIEDTWGVENAMRDVVSRERAELAEISSRQIAEAIAAVVWVRRLHLSASDFLPMLAAHGLDCNEELAGLMDFGLQLLVLTNGKKPIKSRRMAPMSRGRYKSKAKAALDEMLFGISSSS